MRLYSDYSMRATEAPFFSSEPRIGSLDLDEGRLGAVKCVAYRPTRSLTLCWSHQESVNTLESPGFEIPLAQGGFTRSSYYDLLIPPAQAMIRKVLKRPAHLVATISLSRRALILRCYRSVPLVSMRHISIHLAEVCGVDRRAASIGMGEDTRADMSVKGRVL